MFQLFGAALGQDTGPSWHPEPTYRGTADILSTCLITLGLSVWSSLRLNIPAHDRASKQWRNKVPWLLLGLFAPELVRELSLFQCGHASHTNQDSLQIGWAAYSQLRAARSLTSPIRDFLHKQGRPLGAPPDLEQGVSMDQSSRSGSNTTHRQTPERKNEWTIVHSYFALMGGFCIRDVDDPEVLNFMPPSHPRLVLTRQAILFVAKNEPSLIPDISEAFIRDKSKADGLAKALVCFQAVWFCVQCICRVAQ